MSNLVKAAQQALEAWDRPHGINYIDFRPYMDALRAALAEPVQEPVAWLFTNLQSGDYDFCYQEDEHDREMWHKQPLYTARPQRKPLTDEEIDELLRTMGLGKWSVNWLCRAIEQAHGIT